MNNTGKLVLFTAAEKGRVEKDRKVTGTGRRREEMDKSWKIMLHNYCTVMAGKELYYAQHKLFTLYVLVISPLEVCIN